MAMSSVIHEFPIIIAAFVIFVLIGKAIMIADKSSLRHSPLIPRSERIDLAALH